MIRLKNIDRFYNTCKKLSCIAHLSTFSSYGICTPTRAIFRLHDSKINAKVFDKVFLLPVKKTQKHYLLFTKLKSSFTVQLTIIFYA